MTENQDLSTQQAGVFRAPLPPLPDHPLVSILVPTYNEQAFIEETILSMLGQDYGAIELIVADGASTDGTQDILRKYGDDQGLRWISERDSGPISALNKCLRMAHGHLVGIQLANDTYMPGAIREMVAQFAADPRLALVGGWIQYVDAQSVAINRKRTFRNDMFDYSVDDIVTFRGPPPPVQSSLLRRDLILSIGGIDTGSELEIDSFWLHYMLEAARMGARSRALPRIWANIRVHPGQKGTIPQYSGLKFLRARNLGCKRIANLYRDFLTPKQARTLRRVGYYFELKARVVNAHQLLPAIPTALGYVRFGGGPHIAKYLLKTLGRGIRRVIRPWKSTGRIV